MIRLPLSIVWTWVLRILLFLAALVGAFLGAAYTWVHQPIALASAVVDVQIEPGQNARSVADTLHLSGVQTPSWLLHAWFRLSGKGTQIKAGSYELEAPVTPASLLEKLVRGEQAMRKLTLVEGWTFAEVRKALANAPHLRPDTKQMTDAQVMAALGHAGLAPEGRLFPDTYPYSKHSSDLALLKRAVLVMQQQLASAWSQRSPHTPLRNMDELLTLASIVEKETGQDADRGPIAAVFHNRLRIGMRLQTDPSVIYGLGANFDGNLRKADLQADTPWNTYTRAGLPPTPIAMPGLSSLNAAARPPESKALYFVARGDGSSVFSTTLEAHNRAVQRYQRSR